MADSVGNMMPGKSVRDQVGEIQKLIEDASETLRQAHWAMETLQSRLADTPETQAGHTDGGSAARAETGAAQPAQVEVHADVDVAVPAPLDAGSASPRRRHRLWLQGSRNPPVD